MESGELEDVPCEKFLLFKEALSRSRKNDDKLNYKLNEAVPTNSFTNVEKSSKLCQDIQNIIKNNYSLRQNRINSCVEQFTKNLRSLKQSYNESQIDMETMNRVNNIKLWIKLLEADLIIEKTVFDEHMQTINEKCWRYFK